MYNFEGIEKNLARKTFAREEKAKEVAGITSELGAELSMLIAKFQAVYEAYEKEANLDAREKLMSALLEINATKLKLEERMDWSKNFDVAMKVLDVLLVEGSNGLTKDNISADNAKEVWEDFFTQKNSIKSTPLEKK